MVKGVVNTFWFAFFADGLLSFLDEIVTAKIGVSYLSALRGSLAMLVLLLSLGVAGVLTFSPRAPKRVLLPLILFTWWADLCDGFPLQGWDSPWSGFCLAAAQLVLAVGILVLCHSEGSPWNRPFAVGEKPEKFQWKHFLLTGFGLGTAFIVSLLAAVALGLAAKVESETGGYVRLKRDGVYLVERKFQQGDREVWLAGMMHIARHEFYQGVLPQADPALPSVVLLEGVSDHKKLLKGQLDYTHLAKMLHLDSQQDSEYTEEALDGLANQGEAIDQTVHPTKWVRRAKKDGLDFKRADVDVETFSPKTIAFLIATFSLFQSESFQEMSETLHKHESTLLEKGAAKQVMQDILVARNDKLVSEIDSSLKKYRRVIVPWGADHLSGVQTWLIAHDFVQQGEVERKAIAFW